MKNGNKTIFFFRFELLSLALLGVPSMLDSFQEITAKLTALKFDSADYVCLKFILLLNADVPSLGNSSQVQESHRQVRQIALDYPASLGSFGGRFFTTAGGN